MIRSDIDKTGNCNVSVKGSALSVAEELYTILVTLRKHKMLVNVFNAVISESVEMLIESLNDCNPDVIAAICEVIKEIKEGKDGDEGYYEH